MVMSCGHSQLFMFVLKICDMRSIQSEIENRKLLLFSRLILEEHENLVSELFNPIPHR